MIDVDKDQDRIKNYLDKEVHNYLNTEKGEDNAQFMNDSYPAFFNRQMAPEILPAPIHSKKTKKKKSVAIEAERYPQ